MDRSYAIDGVRDPMPGVTYPPAADLARYLAIGALDRQSLIAAFHASMQAHGDRIALLGDGWHLTYGALGELSDRAALAFARLGLRPRDRVVFQVGNGANLVIAVLGCLKAGLIPLCTLHAHREIEIGGLARHAAARAHFIDTTAKDVDFLRFAAAMRAAVGSLAVTVAVEGPGGPDAPTLTALIAAAPLAEARQFVAAGIDGTDPFQVAFFQLSGGSTGLPKIIPRLQNDYLANMRAVLRATGIGPDDCVVTPGPMLHNAGLACFWGPALLVGARVAIPANLRHDGLAGLFDACRPTWLYMPKPLLPRLVEVLADRPAARAALRGIVTSSGGAQVERELGVRAHQFYGMTEGLICFTPDGAPQGVRHHSVGWPIAPGDETRLLRPGTEEEVTPGEPGELVYRGPYCFHGYYDAPAQNAAAFTSDGWVRSGDLVREVLRDGMRALVFEGRLKDLISRGGEKISCEEVERYARTHPAVLDIAVVPAPDPVYGERGCAFVVTEAGRPALDVQGLGRHLGEQGLARYKWPEHVVVLDAFPTTNVGKLDRQALRRQAADLAEARR
jgi:non-ribosomal peptide synthetase component E (peptide arylation enzyme)